MMRALAFAIVLLASHMTHAQGYIGAPPGQMCWDHGWFAARPDGSCHVEDKDKMTPLPDKGTLTSNNTVTNIAPRCDDGYELVIRSDGLMCARDFRKPH